MNALTIPPAAVSFIVPGEPVSKARARFTGYGSKVRTYTPEKTLTAEAKMGWAFRQAGGKFEPDPEVTFGVIATFYNGTRQRRDVDNMLKLVLDGLNGVAWVDDTQVMEVTGRKSFTKKSDARTEVHVYVVGQMDRLTKPCVRCGAEYLTYESHLESRLYCTPECGYAHRVEKRTRVCKNCGGEFVAESNGSRSYCSKECIANRGRVTIPCSICGTAFQQFRSWARMRPYCSHECVLESARRAARLRRTTHFPGTCAICGAGTTRKEYRRCNPCKIAGKEVPR